VPGIGRDLLDVPFAEMVRNLAVAIADGQLALDRNSLETLKTLIKEEVRVVTDITEIIEPVEQTIQVGTGRPPVVVTGAQIRATAAEPVPMSMFQAGLLPTFYHFPEASVEVHISITMREDTETQTSSRPPAGGPLFLDLGASTAYAASVDFRSSNTYSYQSAGSSVLRTTLRSVPPPSRLQPTVTTVNLFTRPPTVTQSS
jgi:hypothetical protein